MVSQPDLRPGAVLITGASGFLGGHLSRYLASQGHNVRAAARDPSRVVRDANITAVAMPDLMQPADWRPLLSGVSHVIHLAGIAHSSANDADYERVNHLATAELASASRDAGVAHFIFVSSVSAQAGASSPRVLSEDDVPAPESAYGRSKLAAEEAVRASGVDFTILRPVVVNGTGAKGNFGLIDRIVQFPVILPLGGLDSRRSILGIKDFSSAVQTVIENPAARGQTYIVAHPEPQTLPQLIAAASRKYRREPLLLSVPPAMLKAALTLLRQQKLWARIGEPLVANPQKLIDLGWKPTPL